MSKQFVCDVCGEPYKLDQPHLELTVQEGVLGPDLSGYFDICDWDCMETLVRAAGDVEEEEEADPSILRQRAILEAEDIEVPEEQIVVPTARPKYAREVEDAGVGVYFPEGMRVDGRPAEQIRRQVPKVRLVRDDG